MKKALIIIVTSLQVLLLCCCEKPETTGQDAQQTSDKVVMIANTSTHDVSVEIFHHSQQIKPFSYCVFQEDVWGWRWSDNSSKERIFLTDSITLVFDDSICVVHTRAGEVFSPSLHNLFDTTSYYTYYGWYHAYGGENRNANITQYTITDHDCPQTID